QVHHHFGEALAYDCLAGSAQNTDPNHQRSQVPGPEPKVYFAPLQIAKRNTEWGYDEVTRRFGDAQRAFIARVADPADPWMKLVEHRVFDGAGATVAGPSNG